MCNSPHCSIRPGTVLRRSADYDQVRRLRQGAEIGEARESLDFGPFRIDGKDRAGEPCTIKLRNTVKPTFPATSLAPNTATLRG